MSFKKHKAADPTNKGGKISKAMEPKHTFYVISRTNSPLPILTCQFVDFHPASSSAHHQTGLGLVHCC